MAKIAPEYQPSLRLAQKALHAIDTGHASRFVRRLGVTPEQLRDRHQAATDYLRRMVEDLTDVPNGENC